MNKKALSIVLALALLVAALPVVAYAATSGSSGGSTDVSFVITETDLTPDSPPSSGGSGDSGGESSGSYIINIPSNISLNHEQDFLVNWTFINIPDTVQVVVSIDGAQTFPDGEFYLYCGDGSTPAQRVACSILRGSSADFSAPMEEVKGPDDAVIAIFRGGSYAAKSYGRVQFGPSYNLSNVAGTYTGTVHFKFDVVGD
jgi:hypothetical protein